MDKTMKEKWKMMPLLMSIGIAKKGGKTEWVEKR